MFGVKFQVKYQPSVFTNLPVEKTSKTSIYTNAVSQQNVVILV